MPVQDVTHIKALYQSIPNLIFIGAIAFLALAVHPAFLFLLLGGELGLLMLAQNAGVQRLLRAKVERERRKDQERSENQMLAAAPESYKRDFLALKDLCGEIESRTRELGPDQPMLDGIVEKLYGLRLEYVRMLRGHFLLANRNYSSIQSQLDQEIGRLESSIASEQSEQVRMTMDQRIQILRQRTSKAKQLAELVRLIEARLQVVSDSLQLIQDEVYSMTDVRGISGVVDDLLLKIEMNEEFRSYYSDVIKEGTPALAGIAADVEDVDSKPYIRPGQGQSN
ncbi:MAG TPA: hypothetical protein VKM94_08000 [Blastocatellia bacterium]|nr:hypothetical protein [Blastocatellia bacterium]